MFERSSDSVEVIVYPKPQVDAGEDRNVCLGGKVSLEVAGLGEQIRWSPPIGLTGDDVANRPGRPIIHVLLSLAPHIYPQRLPRVV